MGGSSPSLTTGNSYLSPIRKVSCSFRGYASKLSAGRLFLYFLDFVTGNSGRGTDSAQNVSKRGFATFSLDLLPPPIAINSLGSSVDDLPNVSNRLLRSGGE